MLLLAAGGCASLQGSNTARPAPLSGSVLDQALQADRAFAAAVRSDGAAAAFGAWYDGDDAQFIDGGQITRGAAVIASRFPPGFTVEWAPDGGHAAAGGDLAVTTGRYSVLSGGVVLETGRYVTVWRPAAGGRLKVIMGLSDADAPQ